MKLVITRNWPIRKRALKTPGTYAIPDREISVEDAHRCVAEGFGFIPEEPKPRSVPEDKAEDKPKRRWTKKAPENKAVAAPENKAEGLG